MATQLTHVIGTFLIQAEGAFLNGAGTESYGQGDITIPKTFYTINEKGMQVPIPYVSSQSWKRWLRDTFLEENNEINPNPILTTDVNKQGNTNKVGAEVDPVEFAEADIFGFMKAEKGQGKAIKEVVPDEEDLETEEETTEPKGKERVKPAIRTSPFQSSILISLRKTGWEGIDKGFVHPKGLSEELAKKKPDANPTPLPYNTKFYDTQLQGIFGLAYHRLGVFRCEGDRIELLPEYQEKYKDKLDTETTKTGNIFRMRNNPRKDRATKILKSLSVMRGGAKQAQFGTPVHPQVLILAGLTSGNLIFNNLFEDTSKGPKVKIDMLEEIIKDFSDRIVTKVYVGIRTGYLQSENEAQLKEWAVKNEKVVICTPIEAANLITEGLPV